MRPHLNFKQCTAKLIRSALFQPKNSASSALNNASIKHCDVSVSLESAGARGWTMHTVIDQLCGCPYQLNGARERKSSWNGGSSLKNTIYLSKSFRRRAQHNSSASALSVECMNIEHCVIECTTSSLWCECGAQTMRNWKHCFVCPITLLSNSERKP